MSKAKTQTRRLKAFGKLSSILLASALAVVLLFITLVLFLLGTEPGTRTTFHLLTKVTPGELAIEHHEGHLLGRLELARVRYHNPTLSLEVEDVVIDWTPRRIWQRVVSINAVEATSVHVKLDDGGAKQETPNAEPFSPTDIFLPVEIRLQRLDVSQISIEQGDFTQRIDRIQAEIYSAGDQHRIEHLSIEVPQGQLNASGHLETSARYPLALEVGASISLQQELPALELEAMINGDLDQLSVKAATQGLVTSDVQASLADYLVPESLNWTARVGLSDTQHPAIAASLSGFELNLSSQGTLEQLSLDVAGWIESRDYGQVDINIDLDYADQRVDIAEFSAIAQEQRGEFTISGFAQHGEQLLVDIVGEGSLLGFTFSEFKIAAEGNEQGASELVVGLSTGSSEFSVQGEFYWQPELRWDLAVEFSQSDLSELNSAITGRLDGQIASQGSLSFGDQSELDVSVQIQDLQGSFEGEDVEGKGNLRVQRAGDKLEAEAESFVLTFGRTHLEANGQYIEDNVDLRWSIKAPSLEELYQPLKGDIESSGHIQGSLDAPTGELNLVGSGLAYADFSVKHARVNLTLDGSLETLPTGRIELESFALGEQEIARIALDLDDNDTRHQTSLQVLYEELEAHIQLNGQWSKADMQWQGELSTLELRYPELGRWRLTQPAPLVLSPNHVQLEQSCLLIASRESEVCLAALWDKADELFELNVETDNLPYQLFSPFMPEDISMLGEFSLNADVTMHASQLNTDIRLHITDSSLRVPAQDLQIDIDGGEILSLQGDHNALQAKLRVLSDQLEGGIESEATISNVLDGNPQITGFVGVDVRRLTLISLLIPDVQNVAGHLNGRIDVDGTIDDLNVSGGLALQDGRAELPATGLDLRDLRVIIEAPNRASEPFTLSGSVAAGEGQIAIAGEYFLQQQLARLTIEGDAFPALNTRDLQVTIAPQLEIEYTPELLKLRGAVDVPRARVTPPDFETVDSISSDTVFVGRDGQEYDIDTNRLPIDMDLTVRLGDDVEVSAYGFEGRLTGRLRIIEQVGQETTAVGNIDVATGEYELYGQSLNIERGRLIFTGGPVANPGLDLRVERRIELDSVTVGARVGGTLQNPTFNLFSSPTMQDSAILSYLLFGRGPGQSDSGEANMLARATLALGMSGGNRLGERLTSTLGVDEISLDAGDTFESTALYIGKQISSRLYIRYGVGLVEPVSTFFIMYRLTENLNFESHTGNERSGADFFYSLERD